MERMPRILRTISILGLNAISALLLFFYLSVNVNAANDSEEHYSVDLSEYILQSGGLGPYDTSAQTLEDGEHTQEGTHWLSSGAKTVEDTIYEGLKKKETGIDISAYAVPSDDMAELYYKVINQHPELFYVESSFGWSSSGGIVTWISPFYNTNFTDADIDTFNQKLAQIMSGVDASWSAVQKILYLHDYLVTNAEYDQTRSKYDAYSCLVEGSSVCQGYALAFKCLMNQIGVNCELVTSGELNHAWNMIELDGEYLFVDATWDDPLGGGETYCGHSNLMVDRSGMEKTGHNSTDWFGSSSQTNVYYDIVSSSRYNEFFWKGLITQVPIIKTKAAYLGDGSILVYDFATGVTNRYSRTQEQWFMWGGSEWWTGDFSSMAAYRGSFYYTGPKNIYRMEPDGTITQVYTLSDSEARKGFIYGLKNTEEGLAYILQTEPWGAVTGTGIYRLVTKIDNFVTRMYEQCLSRDPDQAGLEGWAGQLENGNMNGAQIAEQFVFSEEMLNKNLSDAEFVKVLYRSMMGREADEAGLNGWVNELQGGYLSRSEVTKAFVESTEFTGICTEYGITRGDYAAVGDIERFVTGFYTKCLGRPADAAGHWGWVVNLRDKHMNGAQIAESFFFSEEFVGKNVSDEAYIATLYRTILGREADTAGLTGWVEQLQNKQMTRRDILGAFIESTEFTDLCGAYGIERGNLL